MKNTLPVVVFMGSGTFGLPALRHLAGRADIRLQVVTQPDRPAGRGRADRPTPVAEYAVSAGHPLKKYPSVNVPEVIDELRSIRMDYLIVCDFGQILKPALLALPGAGPYNLHGSILPAYRGAAPIQRGILDGVAQTGVTLLRVTEKCDAGPIVSQSTTDVGPDESFGSLHARLSEMVMPLLKTFLDESLAGRRPREYPQDDSQATMAPKIKKEELRLDFHEQPDRVHRRIRAFSPEPGAYAFWNQTRLKLITATLSATAPTPDKGSTPAGGAVCPTADKRFLAIFCGGGWIFVSDLQPEGGRILSSRDFLNGHPAFAYATLT